MPRSLVLAALLTFSLLARPVLAWHEVGHFLTMLVAYQQLSPGPAPSEAVKKLVAILKQHPRFQADFAAVMPKGMDEDGQDRWLLCRASVWPDLVRGDRDNPPSFPPEAGKLGSYHRGIWHYIDRPLVIVAAGTSAAEVKAIEDKVLAAQDLASDAPAAEADVKNVLQAIAFNRQRLAHGKPDVQAVALCWLLHTIGDLHQPLHATAAFSRAILAPAEHPHGDAGGNSIRLGEHRNLHAIWDAAPDASPDAAFDPSEPVEERYNRAYGRALKQIDALLADHELASQGKKTAAKMDPCEWARESYDLAKTQVYTADIRKQILAADRAPGDSPYGPQVKLPETYRAHAHEIGKLRVVQGGYRTAEFLAGLGIRD